jgi:hypothetical protein
MAPCFMPVSWAGTGQLIRQTQKQIDTLPLIRYF